MIYSESWRISHRRFNSLQTREEGRSQGTIQKGGAKGPLRWHIYYKKISFFETNKKEVKESILSWSCSESILGWFNRDSASIFIILKMPWNEVTIHACRYTSSGILTRKTAGPADHFRFLNNKTNRLCWKWRSGVVEHREDIDWKA